MFPASLRRMPVCLLGLILIFVAQIACVPSFKITLPAPQMGIITEIRNGDAGGNAGFETYIPQGLPPKAWRLESDSSWSKISSNSFQLEGGAEYVLRFDIDCDSSLSTQLHVTIVDHSSLGNNYGIDGSGGGTQLIYKPVIGSNEVHFTADPSKVAAVQAAGRCYWFGFVVGDPNGQPNFRVSNLCLEATGNYPIINHIQNGEPNGNSPFTTYSTTWNPSQSWNLSNDNSWGKISSNAFMLEGGAEYVLSFDISESANLSTQMWVVISDHSSLGYNYEIDGSGGGRQVAIKPVAGHNEITFVADPAKVAVAEAAGHSYYFGIYVGGAQEMFTLSNLRFEATGNYPLIHTIQNGEPNGNSPFTTYEASGIPVHSWTVSNNDAWGKISSNGFQVEAGSWYVLRFDIETTGSLSSQMHLVIDSHPSLSGGEDRRLHLNAFQWMSENEVTFYAPAGVVENLTYYFGIYVGSPQDSFTLSNLSLERLDR